MHPTLESGAFVLVFQSTNLYLKLHNLKYCRRLKFHKFRFINFRNLKSGVNRFLGVQVGDMVVVNHNQYGQIIKRVLKIKYAPATDLLKVGDNKPSSKTIGCINNLDRQVEAVQLAGDNKFSSISQDQMGWVSIHNIMGKVVYAIVKEL